MCQNERQTKNMGLSPVFCQIKRGRFSFFLSCFIFSAKKKNRPPFSRVAPVFWKMGNSMTVTNSSNYYSKSY